MEKISTQFVIFGKAFKRALVNIFRHPRLLFPFFSLALLEGAALCLWYYSPRPPVSKLLAPFVKAFFGDIYLHYPMNFLLLPRLEFLSRVVIYCLFAGVALSMSASAVFQVEKEKRPPRLFGNFNRALRRFFPVFFVFLLAAFCGTAAYKLPRLILIKFFISSPAFPVLKVFIVAISFLLNCLVEMFFVFVPVYLVVFREKFFASIRKSFRFAGLFFLPLGIFVAGFRSLDLLMNFFKSRLTGIVEHYFPIFPEFILYYLSLDITVFFIVNSIIVTVCFGLVLNNEKQTNAS